MPLSKFGITPKPADAKELEALLVTVQVGIADPAVLLLLCHVAWLASRVAQLEAGS